MRISKNAPAVQHPSKPSSKVLASSSCLKDIEDLLSAGSTWKQIAAYFSNRGYEVDSESLRIAARKSWLAAGISPPKKNIRTAKTNPFKPAAYGLALAPAYAAARASGWTVENILEDLALAGWSLSKRTLETALRASAGGRSECEHIYVSGVAPSRPSKKKRPALFKPKLLVRLLLPLIDELAGSSRDWQLASSLLAKSGFLIEPGTLKRYVSLAKEYQPELPKNKG